MFRTGKFREKNEIIACLPEKVNYEKINKNELSGHFWGYFKITARELKCVVFHGTASNLKKILEPNLHR